MTEQQIAAAWNEQPFPLDLPLCRALHRRAVRPIG